MELENMQSSTDWVKIMNKMIIIFKIVPNN